LVEVLGALFEAEVLDTSLEAEVVEALLEGEPLPMENLLRAGCHLLVAW
jgi:hypothetical protein